MKQTSGKPEEEGISARRQGISTDKLRNNQGLWEASQDENEKEQMDSGDYPAGFSGHVNMWGRGRIFSFKKFSDCFYFKAALKLVTRLMLCDPWCCHSLTRF